ncbi:MAG: protein translocase subunit SecD [Cyclonatronaceae bacterium]
MKESNGTKIFFIIGFILVTGYYLQFSVRHWLEQRHINSLDEEARVEYVEANFERLNNLRERTLNFGLDLQGGMYVTLELATGQLLGELAREFRDDEFNDVLSTASQRAFENNTDVIDEFVDEFESRDPQARLSRYFRSDSDNITRQSTNDEIKNYLQSQRNSAVDRAVEIIRNRIDRFGVTEPSIVKQGSNRIVVELPGVDDEERVRNLLRGTARLEFRTMANPSELQTSLRRIIDFYETSLPPADGDTLGQATRINTFTDVFIPVGESVIFGYAATADTAEVMEKLRREEVQRMLPRDTELMWAAQSERLQGSSSEYYTLLGVRKQVELTGEVITDARPSFDPQTNQPEVSMTMNREGARRWSILTGANIGRPVAIILDGYVYSYPTVRSQITEGRSSISGIGGLSEAEDLVNILLSGALPAPLDIVEERTVGATLGEASIRSGFRSAIWGLTIVALFMIFYYRAGGAIADLALILNIIFILGILAAFRATLTLPGIAGIVLTIGMAVDANVLIFDRIREEMRVGKSLVAAIDSGYKNAMSAILDANITTFLTAVILFSFGMGPIKGFAVTLMAGIIASLFSAIVITRVIVDSLTRGKGLNVSFG